MIKEESFYGDLYTKIAPYLTLKTVTWFLLTVLGGSGLLGILSEFATYSYAIYYGFRPPVEGIPYLRVTITLVSFVLVIISMVTIIVIYLIAKFNLKLYSHIQTRIKTKRMVEDNGFKQDIGDTEFFRDKHNFIRFAI